ncbi:DUF2589 domain-containing protein [Myroides sp. WP-1]|uniref:DUF2589 domain-containing protein n=1 Tax=Myroides sp. WP-1 TaxID=2759944 RepID=UPI0015FDCF40|nr:DUF2589 domain-containing protein [Myroides sp. WP-1]MBB1138095.1 DUF2589 domain-containing protein [Myroides sp. WP-1]
MTSISLKKFIQAIHSAIQMSNEQIVDQNLTLLDRYFEEKEVPSIDLNGQTTYKKTLVPKTVTLSYPQKVQQSTANEDSFTLLMEPVEVPLISMIPLGVCGVKKATFTTAFQMEVIEDELQIHFGKPTGSIVKKAPHTNFGKLELTLSPQETTEGLRLLSEGYENYLKRQIT